MPVIPTYAETVADATHSFGTRLVTGPYTPGTPDTFFLIGDVKDIAFNGRKINEIDVSHFLSPGKYKEFIPGFGDSGVVSFKTNYSDEQFDAINAYVPTPTTIAFGRRRWIIVTPDLGEISFVGYMQPPNPTFPDDGAIELACEIRVSGPITITP